MKHVENCSSYGVDFLPLFSSRDGTSFFMWMLVLVNLIYII